MDPFNLYFPLPFGPHSTPGQLSHLEVLPPLSTDGRAGKLLRRGAELEGAAVGSRLQPYARPVLHELTYGRSS